MAPSGLLLQHAHMPMPTLTPSRTRNSHSHLYIHAPRVPRRTVSDGIYSLAVSRGQSVEAVPFPRSLVPSFIGAPLDLLFLAICAVKSSPGLGCLAAGLSLPVILDNPFCYIRAVPTSQQPIDLSFLFVGSCPCHAFFRLSIHSLALRASSWQTDRRQTDRHVC